MNDYDYGYGYGYGYGMVWFGLVQYWIEMEMILNLNSNWILLFLISNKNNERINEYEERWRAAVIIIY